jgi:hypothetical protein
MTVSERFWAKVNKTDDCWEWTAYTSKGYGQFNATGVLVRAHRFAYQMANGPIPAGRLVCHRCDNRRCVRPSHLFVGTAADNTLDMVRKGRGRVPPPRFGESHHNVKLNSSQVVIMRRMRSFGVPVLRLARDWGINKATVKAICKGTARRMG